MKQKKKIEDALVEEKEFDAVLSQLLKMEPIPLKKLKTTGRKGPKGPLIRRKP